MVLPHLWFYNPHNCSIIWAILEMGTLRHRTFKWLVQVWEYRIQRTLSLNSWHPFTRVSTIIHHVLKMAWSLHSISETLWWKLIWSRTRFMILRKEYEPFPREFLDLHSTEQQNCVSVSGQLSAEQYVNSLFWFYFL